MVRRKRIAFIRPKAWPLVNSIVDGVIKDEFPDHEVDVIDVTAMVRQRPTIILVNSIVTAFLYGKDIILRKKKFRLAFWRTPYIFREIRKLIRDRVANGGYSFTFQTQSLFDASVPGIPHFVYTDHTHMENLNYEATKKNLYSSKWIALEKEIYENAALTFLWSSNVKRSLIEDYGIFPHKAVLAYAGSNGKVSKMKTQNIDYTQSNILFVGLDWQRKGGPTLVKAFQMVRKQCPEARLIIVGAKPDLHIPNCDVIGPTKPQELDQYYQQASVFCMPTNVEPFGMVFVEAMTAHLPIVATRLGAIPDFVEEGKNGFLVSPNDVEGIADALQRLLQNPQMCHAFGEYGFQLAENRYTWKAIGKIFRENIMNVLSQSEE